MASAASAGDPAIGKICAFSFDGFIPDGTIPELSKAGTGWVNVPCRQAMSISGNDAPAVPNLQVPQVRVVWVTGPFRNGNVLPGCERGREFQVLVERLTGGGTYWIYPRYLNCP